MTCLSSADGTLHVCLASWVYLRAYRYCRRCKRRHGFVICDEPGSWYGPHWLSMACGTKRDQAKAHEYWKQPTTRERWRELLHERIAADDKIDREMGWGRFARPKQP